MRVIVCGGRKFRDAKAVFEALDWLLDCEYDAAEEERRLPEMMIVHGDAAGADALADAWAQLREADREPHPADWRPNGHYDPKAGPRRNEEMANAGADLCLAFKGGHGTEDMIRRAKHHGIEVMRWPEDRDRWREPKLSKLMGERA